MSNLICKQQINKLQYHAKGFFHVPKAVNEPVKGMHQIT
jgi:hypothetical protein